MWICQSCGEMNDQEGSHCQKCHKVHPLTGAKIARENPVISMTYARKLNKGEITMDKTREISVNDFRVYKNKVIERISVFETYLCFYYSDGTEEKFDIIRPKPSDCSKEV